MDGGAEADPKPPLPLPPLNLKPTTATSTSSSSSSSSLTSSPPGLLRHVQAAFKRHRPLGTTQLKDLRPRRAVVPTRQASRVLGPNTGSTVDPMKSQDAPPLGKVHAIEEFIMQSKSTISNIRDTHDDASITPPSLSGTISSTLGESFNPFNAPANQLKPVIGCSDTSATLASHLDCQIDHLKKLQFSVGETDWSTGIHVEMSTNANEDLKYHNVQTMDSVNTSRSDVEIPSQVAKKTAAVQDQLHQFRNFLSQPATQSSVIGPSFATTTSVHSTSAPMLSSTTYTTRSHQDGDLCSLEPVGDLKVNPSTSDRDNLQFPSLKVEDRANDQAPKTAQAGSSTVDTVMGESSHNLVKEEKVEKELHLQKDLFSIDAKMSQEKGAASDVSHVHSRRTLSKETSSAISLGPSQSGKHEKAIGGKGTSIPRKRNYDPDMFFKVNGKLYQRLGKIGSGGSSEVHKVISSDCTIYALKKIKLKGRDYATAYGFCQEIEYLNKLRGKNNIIQLVDYEVTDKNLLNEVLSGSMNNKDGRVTDDGYIYMVLEYGEIDLAHMLSQKWKEMDSTDQIIDENWLRFYWQQILLAVNTIHEERIVHSDLKPANFLLVRGSLKLIDFGIAKAIMSDTTNIQRDSQVGTLSYMSPEAFMCNESDANGNIIKCGRPSDIWSLGCILYQMVYGRTPFAEYKTFWSKFKVITNPNHEITYEPVSNPWLLDIMKKCLAWDRNERWRIPQLLKHPFLVPPIPPQTFPLQNDRYRLLQQIGKACKDDREASALCVQVKQILEDPMALVKSHSLASSDLQCMLLSQLSKLCFQLSEHLSKPDR